MQCSFHFAADPCYHYENLSEANRKIDYITPRGSELCDYELPEGWYARMCQHTDVVQTGQAGWKVLILQWKIVKFKGRSALVIAPLVAETQEVFL